MFKAKSFPVNLNELDTIKELNETFIKKSPSFDCIDEILD